MSHDQIRFRLAHHLKITIVDKSFHMFVSTSPSLSKTVASPPMEHAKFRIISARTAEHLATARALFTAYVEWLNIDLSYQNFQAELDSLPGKYAAPDGELLLAYGADNTPLGCAAIRPLRDQDSQNQGYCEIKRLYVSPEARGLGLGKALVVAIVQRAKELGYREMRLDTLPFMQGAIRLYTRMGFVKIDRYYETPIEDTVFLALNLTK
ncbi:acyl-CoA N-acyltransferase [Aspergillus granulosus]|uniref:Acyl-CoA N-acyltransferase n=1 Tax=Aspergillus granulosus TaxID=176169 RepID=A0ABR4H1J5_9EURO